MDINHYNTWVKIGLNILHYRKEQRLTQAQLSEMIGVTEQHFRGWRLLMPGVALIL